MKISMFCFGENKNGNDEITGYKLENKNHYSVKIINYGATVISFKMPDREGNVEEIQLSLPDIDSYRGYSPYFGATVGRVANRINNGFFSLDGKEYQLAKNEDGISHLHGGERGFDKVLWDIKASVKNGAGVVECAYTSKDGEEGYPGNLTVKVIYMLTDENEFIINYSAETTAATPVNLTNHTYWNLSGNKKRKILNHKLQLNCSSYLDIDGNLIPTGNISTVANSVMDFRSQKKIGSDIEAVGGYDHCYVMRMQKGTLAKIAEVTDPDSGRSMEIATTEPAVQFYTGNFLDELDSFGYTAHDAFCLETQHFPDAVNHADFPSVILRPGEKYHHETVHRFFIN